MGRSFFDFVAQKDEDVVRSWIDVIKGWGVNERGQPSDGGFGFGKFALCKEGRDSSCDLNFLFPPSQKYSYSVFPGAHALLSRPLGAGMDLRVPEHSHPGVVPVLRQPFRTDLERARNHQVHPLMLLK